MKLSSLIFFSYFRKKFSELEKLKKSRSKKMSYISGNGTFQPQVKKALIFFLKKVFLIFQEGICKT